MELSQLLVFCQKNSYELSRYFRRPRIRVRGSVTGIQEVQRPLDAGPGSGPGQAFSGMTQEWLALLSATSEMSQFSVRGGVSGSESAGPAPKRSKLTSIFSRSLSAGASSRACFSAG